MRIRTITLTVFILSALPLLSLTVKEDPAALSEQAVRAETPGLIKAFIAYIREELEVDYSRLPELIRETESYATSINDPAGKSILHSMAAELYREYHRKNEWIIRQRTRLSDYVPEDIREWTDNLFVKKIKEELSLSLEQELLLQQTTASSYISIMEKGKDMEQLRPTLYDFLVWRAIDMEPSDELYGRIIRFRRSQPEKQALMVAELGYLSYLYKGFYDESSKREYIAALDSLLGIYGNESYSIDIVSMKGEAMERFYKAGSEDSTRAAVYGLYEEAVKRFPNTAGTALLKNKIAEMENPEFNCWSENTVYTGESLKLNISYRNIRQAKVSLYAVDYPLSGLMYNDHPGKDEAKRTLVKEQTFTLDPPVSYNTYDTILHVSGLKAGLYECVLSAPGKGLETREWISVSRLAAVYRQASDSKTEVLVTDYKTGEPIEGAAVSFYGERQTGLKKVAEVFSDKDGIAHLPGKNRGFAMQASLPGDTAMQLSTMYASNYIHREAEHTNVSLFTDRGLYRPGQNVFFKGIVYYNHKGHEHVAVNHPVKVSLRDGNNNEISSKEFKSNEYGSFNGEFTLPRTALSGYFSIEAAGYASYAIRVEEYKRPTFKAEILPVKENTAFGDTVNIKGKAETFSGVQLNGGNVSWRVTRRSMWGYGGHGYGQTASGETGLAEDGGFSFSFTPEKEEGVSLLRSYYAYEISAVITDSKGESQECRYILNIGDTSFILLAELSEKVEKENASLVIKANTLNGEKIEATGTYTIYALGNGREFDTNPAGKKEVGSGDFETDKAIASNVFANLESGRYLLLAKSFDDKNREVAAEQTFVLYSKKDKRPPVYSPFWMIGEHTECLPGEDARFYLGSSVQGAHILYDLYSSGKLVSRERFTLNNEAIPFTIPFREEWGDGAVAVFTFIKEGELYENNILITRKPPDKKLNIKPVTFRDKLIPGTKESWSFNITDAGSAAVQAEVLAGMYDASLDKISFFDWYFTPERPVYIPVPRFITGASFDRSNQYASKNIAYLAYDGYAYNSLDWQGALINRSSNQVLRRAYASAVSDGIMLKSAAEKMPESEAEAGTVLAGAGTEDNGGTVQIRQNFNETAFFFPVLRTNEQGDILLNFILPESNTSWKLQLLAHTPGLQYGKLTKEVVAGKPLMVVPNLPRFIRRGDHAAISSQIYNQQEETVNGNIRIELFDPETGQAIQAATPAQPSVPFRLEAGASTSVSWNIAVPGDISLIGCRIIADSEAGSDGEQHLLPVLSDKILVTESTPFYFYKQEEKRIDAAKGGRKPFRLTLEMSGNPVWYAVQALPAVITPENANILSRFAAYYGNTLATHIANSHPGIRQAIRQWSAGEDPGTLSSNLERNEELKHTLLEEMPWVAEARNETEQKARLSLLFDLNRASGQRDIAMHHLLEEQNSDGGWGWFKGYHSDRIMTLAILKSMSQLKTLNAVQYKEEEKTMQIDALHFLDKSMAKDYEQLKNSNRQRNIAIPDAQQLTCLYVRSGYRDIPEPDEAREAIRFYTAQAEKEWKAFDLQGKAETAILMFRNGKKNIAAEIIADLRRTATTSGEMGMYWANNRRGSGFFVSPVDVHTLIMEAFREAGEAQIDEVNRMKQWLLNQKRTQNWETTPATLNAIHAILMTGDDWLSEGNEVVAGWSGNTLSTASGEVATGYVRKTFGENEITAEMNTFSIVKSGNSPAWGAVYRQYFEPLDKVTASKGSLQVDKKLFVEFNSGTERQMKPVSEGQLKVGDKAIVRLTIRTDREMDYVVLKDQRAGCFEPVNQLSGYVYQGGNGYYQSPKDISQYFFFRTLPVGTYVIEYPVSVSRPGQYASGISAIQCMYAPEFVSHTSGGMLTVSP